MSLDLMVMSLNWLAVRRQSVLSPHYLFFLTFSAHCAHLPICHRVQSQHFCVPWAHHSFPACPHFYLFHHLLLLWKQHLGYRRKCAQWHSMDKWHSRHHPPSSHRSHPSPWKQLLSRHRVLEGREPVGWASVCFQGSDATSGQPIRGASHQQVSQWVQCPTGYSGAQK